MKSDSAIRALAALAQETRLGVFRRLIAAGPGGLTAGAIAALAGTPSPTLSFHLKELEAAKLIKRRRDGRHIHYSVNHSAVRELLGFLTEDCCQGRPELCAPRRPSQTRARAAKVPA